MPHDNADSCLCGDCIACLSRAFAAAVETAPPESLPDESAVALPAEIRREIQAPSRPKPTDAKPPMWKLPPPALTAGLSHAALSPKGRLLLLPPEVRALTHSLAPLPLLPHGRN